MYEIIYINIFITLVTFMIFLITNFKFNFNKLFFNKFFYKNVLFYFFKKNTKTLIKVISKSIFFPNKIIFWKPIFKKTSYIGYFFNNNNKWR